MRSKEVRFALLYLCRKQGKHQNNVLRMHEQFATPALILSSIYPAVIEWTYNVSLRRKHYLLQTMKLNPQLMILKRIKLFSKSNWCDAQVYSYVYIFLICGCQLDELQIPSQPPAMYHLLSFMFICDYASRIFLSLVLHCLLLLLIIDQFRAVSGNPLSLSLFLFLSLYIYIYIYIERERLPHVALNTEYIQGNSSKLLV